jgi:hypothetical protein
LRRVSIEDDGAETYTTPGIEIAPSDLRPGDEITGPEDPDPDRASGAASEPEDPTFESDEWAAVLYHTLGRSIDEIAAELGVPADQIRDKLEPQYWDGPNTAEAVYGLEPEIDE